MESLLCKAIHKKDSMVLLCALAKLREFYPAPFELHAVTVHPGAPEMDFAPVAELCRELNVPYHTVQTEIFPIIFEYRKEKNPCSMCAKMRRGAMHNALRELGISKAALGHHRDDAVETFFLSLFYEGRLSCFQPVTYLDRTGIIQIRPLLYCGEEMVRGAAAAAPWKMKIIFAVLLTSLWEQSIIVKIFQESAFRGSFDPLRMSNTRERMTAGLLAGQK